MVSCSTVGDFSHQVRVTGGGGGGGVVTGSRSDSCRRTQQLALAWAEFMKWLRLNKFGQEWTNENYFPPIYILLYRK